MVKTAKKAADWLYFNFLFDIITYLPTVIGRRLRSLQVRILSKSSGKDLNVHFGTVFIGLPNMIFGDNVVIGHYSVLSARSQMKIGNNCMIAGRVLLITHNHGYRERNVPMRQQKQVCNPLIIEDDVWIGAGAVINSGSKPVRIAKGVIVGANTVVTRDCDIEYGIYAGSPAQFVRGRFDD